MSTMAATSGGSGAALPRRNNGKTKLVRDQKLTLAEQYLEADEQGKNQLIRKWGRGRVRRSLLEFAKHEHELEYKALREREDI